MCVFVCVCVCVCAQAQAKIDELLKTKIVINYCTAVVLQAAGVGFSFFKKSWFQCLLLSLFALSLE